MLFFSQVRDLQWRKTIIKLKTSQSTRLPIVDFASYDTKDGEFGVELGPVCFS